MAPVGHGQSRHQLNACRAPRARIAGPPGDCHHARAVPTYDYTCRACGAVSEVVHSMTDPGPTTCEVCGGELRRMLYPAGIIFKGSGFYRNDSRPASSTSVAGATPAAPKGDSGPSGGTPPASGDG